MSMNRSNNLRGSNHVGAERDSRGRWTSQRPTNHVHCDDRSSTSHPSSMQDSARQNKGEAMRALMRAQSEQRCMNISVQSAHGLEHSTPFKQLVNVEMLHSTANRMSSFGKLIVDCSKDLRAKGSYEVHVVTPFVRLLSAFPPVIYSTFGFQLLQRENIRDCIEVASIFASRACWEEAPVPI